MSTLDSALHALATVTWEEIKGINRFSGISDRNQTIILRLLSVFYGIIATGLAFLCNNLGSLISAGGTLFGACMGPMFGYTLVSILVPFVNLKVWSPELKDFSHIYLVTVLAQLLAAALIQKKIFLTFKLPHEKQIINVFSMKT